MLRTNPTFYIRYFRRHFWIIHIVFWILYSFLSFKFIEILLVENTASEILTAHFITFSIQLALVYFNLFIILRVFVWHKLHRYFIYILLSLCSATSLQMLTLCVTTQKGLWFANEMDWNFIWSPLGGNIFLLLFTLMIPLTYNGLRSNLNELRYFQSLRRSEMNFLYLQNNPHFLLNMLNNIYALIETEPKKAAEMLLKLSDMMRFMLYECREHKILLTDELDFIADILSMYQLKNKEPQNVEWELIGDAKTIRIEPMLLVPLFENVLKHGNLEQIEKGWLKGRLSLSNQTLHLELKNSLPTRKKKNSTGGIGIANLKRRLQILYPNRHQLEITQTISDYTVLLTINFLPNDSTLLSS